tara:strand:- start:118 stop:429 length:312 start_codon:yes stop_codon:yes gene_type:complete
MKKISLILTIFFLILITAFIKNSTKQIEDEIFSVKENLRVLNFELENTLLENNYLSSAEKLLEYQSLYFEDELIKKNIKKFKIIKIKDGSKIFLNLKLKKEDE